MSDQPLARFHFYPWVRRGIAAAFQVIDDIAAPAPLRPQLSADIQIEAHKDGNLVDTQHAAMSVNVYGPADVRGLDPRHVIRTEPRNLTANFEPNYLAGIEFDLPDLPWLLTPAAPNGDHLRPWLVLLVLKPEEFAFFHDPPFPLEKVTVSNLGALPDLADSWAWSHAQITGDLPANGIDGVLANAPGNAISRLICPRHLEPETGYFAFLVPAFEGGRLAGLGLDLGQVSTTVPAWPPAGSVTTIDLPVYYRFEFHTSGQGDFESLVRQMAPRELPAEVGTRLMDVSRPAPSPFPSAGPPLGLAGALRSRQSRDTDWIDPARSQFQAAVAALINLTTPATDDPDHPRAQDPKVVPPIYGQWAAAVNSVDPRTKRWIDSLNLDPRNRVGSGLGTRVVDAQRGALLASAWQQVAGIERANQLLRSAQLSRATTRAAYQKNFLPAPDEVLLSLTQAVHSKTLASPRTVHATLKTSSLPVRALSGAFRRIVRPQGPLRRRQGASNSAATLAAKLNNRTIRLVPPVHDPAGMRSTDQVSDLLLPAWMPWWLRRVFSTLLWLLIGILAAGILVMLAIGLLVGFSPLILSVTAALTAAAGGMSALMRNQLPRAAAASIDRFQNMSAEATGLVPPRPGFALAAAGQPFPTAQTGGIDSDVASRFRLAAARMTVRLQAPAQDPAPPGPADLALLKSVLVKRLDPSKTVPAYALSQLRLGPGLKWRPRDPISPIMAYPVFDQPMYGPLRDLSPDYLLPGLEKIPPETMAVVLTNQAFIESYMVGLNHEMARQLLWVNFPTDLRGSPFRQFWDVASYVPTSQDPTDPEQLDEKLRDIRPLHKWALDRALGANGNRPEIASENLVLLLRGELLRRYPNAIIYACKAQWDPNTQLRQPSETEKYPLFRGTLDPDVTFFGFDLTAAQARGADPAAGGDPGWFFVFKQHPSEHRFGLEPLARDPATSWAELAWPDFPLEPRSAGAALFLSPKVAPQNLQITPGSSDEHRKWGEESAQTAYILYRRPARIAVHASLMLSGQGE